MEVESLCEEALVCPLCCEVFRYPVTLQCGHSSCKLCLQKFWEWKDSRECPVCRQMEVSQRPAINLALKIASDRFLLERQDAATALKTEEFCAGHNEKLKLFCQRDEMAICFVCQLSKEHRNHECCPVEDAVKDRKAGIAPRYTTLSNQLGMLERVRDNWREMEIYIKTQAEETEALIKEEFEKLHSFLREEEAARLAALREEEERKAERMRKKLEDISKQVEDLSAIIRDIDATMSSSDIQFLKDYKKTLGSLRYTMQEPEVLTGALIDSVQHVSSLKYSVWRKMANMVHHSPLYLDPNTAQANLVLSDELTSVHYGDYKKTLGSLRYTMQEPEVLTGALIDSVQHVSSLKYSVWRKMANMVHHSPLYLDPNTAQANLVLSDELTSVHYGEKSPVPNNHERCSSRTAVLAVAGFTSGKHSWEVDVGDGTDWYIGLARESINRKDTVFLNPAEGFWVIGLCNSNTYWAQTSPRTRLAVRSKPCSIKVELDYDKGKVTFLNTADGSVMHTFKEKFTEKVYPFFSPGMYEEGKRSPSPLKICPQKPFIILY